MSDYLADFMFSNMVRPPHARRNSRPGRRFTGAAITSSTLVLATVEAVNFRELQLCEEDSNFFVLENRSQRSARYLFNQVETFVRERDLRHVLLRASPGSGKYTAAPTTYMIEGMLNLVKGLHLEIVAPLTVNAWVQREGRIAPPCPLDTPRMLRDAFDLAIYSACLSEARERDPSLRPSADEL